MSGSEQPPADPRPSTKAAERLAVIVDAAERAALNVIDDAEKEARRYLDEAQARADLIVAERLREAADLIERQGGSGSIAPLLRPVAFDPSAAEEEEAEDPRPAVAEAEAEEASDSVKFDRPSPAAEAEQPADGPAEDESQAAKVPESDAKDEPEPAVLVSAKKPLAANPPEPVADEAAETKAPAGSAAARLLATQMAVSGSSRTEIEMRLRNGFEIEDTSEILDAILGPEE